MVRPGVLVPRRIGAVSRAAARRAAARGRHGALRVRYAGYRFVAADSCLCGSRSAEPVARRRELGRTVGLVLCRDCGLGRLSPRIDAGSLERYYGGDYRRTIRGTDRIDDAYFERGRRRGRRLVEFLEESGFAPPRGSPVVEVGAGAGGILAVFAERGHPVAGSDLDPSCVAYAQAQGLAVTRGEAIEATPAIAPAGLIVLSHLLEHLPDPLATLAELRPFVGPETVLYLEVPGLRAGRPAGEQIQLPHLYYYDLTTLQWLLAEVGFALALGDERIRAVFRPGAAEAVEVAGNFDRNVRQLVAVSPS